MLTNTTSGVGLCCLALSSLLGNKVSFPNTPQYTSSLTSYFSQQNSNLHPLCVVSPTTPADISTAITSITTTSKFLPPNANSQSQCHFALRSGGHTTFGGASNINNGITFDLSALNSTVVSDDRTTVSVGVGATWGDVYTYLEPLGLAVAGGRAAQVGVGGLTLGGGISYFSPRYGWTCDTVAAFEVVLSNGTIIHVTDAENPDLAVALRGGGSNFGVITRVELRAFEQGPVWGGSVYYSLETVDAQLRAFSELNGGGDGDGYDEFASLITSFGYAAGTGAGVVNSIVYTREEERPAVFEKFFEMPVVDSSMRVAGMREIAEEQGSFSPDGRRQMMVVTTHGSTVSMLNATYLRWNSSLASIEAVPGIVWSISLEPLPPSIYARAPRKNSLGLGDGTEPLVVTLLSASWDDEADDARVEDAARGLFQGIEQDARRLDSYEPFVYLNYAAEWQDPVASYGRESVEKLQRVSRDVDPKAVFRTNMPGGFKIPEQ
ncbi:hypothetical protein BDW59DRAFT_150682 [Aspergillus cavernicola]|uniref:FAD-binding PCMH-type domain-containing protein n=1 Tax=Aspergillus cavernicola TaxID=176166 RepID=A0ABR4HYI4_9EURO